MKNTSAPPIVFLYALVIAAVFFVSISFLAYNQKLLPLNPEQLRRESKAGNFKVVVVGTSLTGHAFYPDLEFEKFASSKGLGNLSFYRFAWSGRHLELHDQLFKELVDFQPDLVLLESKLIYYSNSNNALEAWFIKICDFLSSLLHGNSNRSYVGYEVSVQKGFLTAKSEKPESTVNAASFAHTDRAQRGFDPTNALDYFLRQSQINSLPVLLFELPLAAEVEALYPPEHRTYERLIDQQYLSHYGVSQLKCNISLAAPFYREDLAHVNQKGRARLSDWLITNLKVLQK